MRNHSHPNKLTTSIYNLLVSENLHYTNKNDVVFDYTSDTKITSSYFIKTPEYPQFNNAIKIFSDHEGFEGLIEDYQIRSTLELTHSICKNDLFRRFYKLGNGKITCDISKMLSRVTNEPIDLFFECEPSKKYWIPGKTKIYVPYLFYFDLVNEEIVEDHQFPEYIEKQKNAFLWLFKNRHIIEFAKNINDSEN